VASGLADGDGTTPQTAGRSRPAQRGPRDYSLSLTVITVMMMMMVVVVVCDGKTKVKFGCITVRSKA